MASRGKTSKSVRKKTGSKKKIVSKSKKKRVTAKPLKKSAAKKIVKKKVAKKAVKKGPVKKRAVAKSAAKRKPSTVSRRAPKKKRESAPESYQVVTSETVITSVSAPSVPEISMVSIPGVLIGKVTHYYNHAGAAVIELEHGNLHVGDTIHIKGHTTDFDQVVDSIQVNGQNIEAAEQGQTIGIRVRDVVREHDMVYKTT